MSEQQTYVPGVCRRCDCCEGCGKPIAAFAAADGWCMCNRLSPNERPLAKVQYQRMHYDRLLRRRDETILNLEAAVAALKEKFKKAGERFAELKKQKGTGE